MRKKDNLHLLKFPSLKERRIKEIKRDLATLYDPISQERAIILAEVLRQSLGSDNVSVEALLALVCAMADPTGDPEKFATAKTVLMEMSLMNSAWIAERKDGVYLQMWQDSP